MDEADIFSNIEDCLENWMSKLPDMLRDAPVIHLAIPGSHDSGTCTITRSSAVSPDTSPVIKQFCKVCGAIVKRIVYNWVITQHWSVTDQLNKGIRYLDLRLASKPGTKSLFFVHGLYGDEINSILKEVEVFLNFHSKEIVILDFQHFYDFTENDHSNLLSIIHSTFERRLCPMPGSLYHVTLNWMNANGYQVIVIYRHQAAARIENFWPSYVWPTPWPDTTNVEAMLKFLSERMAKRPQNAGYVTQCVLTPDGPLIMRHPLSTLEEKCATVCNSKSVSWLKEQSPGHLGVNVVILDFVDMRNIQFCKTVIQLNKKLLKQDTQGLNTIEMADRKQ